MTAAPFTAQDFAWRLGRGAEQARDAGLTGLLVTPGPDLLYFTGYAPIAITERITMLVIDGSREPSMIVPILERPDAEDAPAAGVVSLTDWKDGDDPYAATAALLDPEGRYAISDSAWAMHVLGLQATLPGVELRLGDERAPDAARGQERGRDRAARRPRVPLPTRASRTSPASASRAARRARSPPTSPASCASTDTRRSTSPSSAPGPTAPTRTTR